MSKVTLKGLKSKDEMLERWLSMGPKQLLEELKLYRLDGVENNNSIQTLMDHFEIIDSDSLV